MTKDSWTFRLNYILLRMKCSKAAVPIPEITEDWVGFDLESSPSKFLIRSTIPSPIDDYSFSLDLLGWEATSAGLIVFLTQ